MVRPHKVSNTMSNKQQRNSLNRSLCVKQFACSRLGLIVAEIFYRNVFAGDHRNKDQCCHVTRNNFKQGYSVGLYIFVILSGPKIILKCGRLGVRKR